MPVCGLESAGTDQRRQAAPPPSPPKGGDTETIFLLTFEPMMTGRRARRHSKALNKMFLLNPKADMMMP